jgi:integrase
MSVTQPDFSKVKLNYLPATLRHTAHGWTIEYSVLDPSTNAMQRKVAKMNRIRNRFGKISDFKAYCNHIVCDLNTRLAGGWTPFGEQQNSRLFTPIEAVLDDYLGEKAKELRPDTVINYRSFCKCMKDWVGKVCPNAQCGMFNKVLAVRFMDHILNEKGLTGRSYNNKLKQARAFFSWAVEKCYCKENPFASMKTKREEAKRRILIPADTRAMITGYFEANNPNYLVLCRLVFNALVRPKEVWRLKVADICLEDGYILVGEDKSKTHFSRIAALTPQLIKDIRTMIVGAKPSMYLFGHGYKPNAKPIRYNNFREDWNKMRIALGLPDTMQLYSLRDTGINEMLKCGIDPLTVMQHADHHDLSMTTRYANHVDPHLVDIIRTKAPKF